MLGLKLTPSLAKEQFYDYSYASGGILVNMGKIEPRSVSVQPE